MFQVVNAYGEVVRDDLDFQTAIHFCSEQNDNEGLSQANKPYVVLKKD